MRTKTRISVVLFSLSVLPTLSAGGLFETKSKEGEKNVSEAHWAFEQVVDPEPPNVDSAWVSGAIDRFVFARLQLAGLEPSAAVDRTTWLRRVTIDLIGLPPTPDEVDSFLGDDSTDAREKVVDRLLASPRRGERWGRHWLDIARYADTKGYVFTAERRFPYSYTYRDYVVRSLNEDLPYDRFVVEQIAADRLDLGDDPRPLAAMGFLTLGRRFLNNAHDIIDDRIDVVTRGLLALTVQCARCHDHKYDPIPTADYYSLYGVFASSVEPKELPKIGAPEDVDAYEQFRKELKKRQKAVDDFRATLPKKVDRAMRDQLRELEKRVDELHVEHAGAPARAMALADASTPHDPRIFLRGKSSSPGDSVPRRFLGVLAGKNRKPFTDGSGRLELARAIVDERNPLTARVVVNRVWMHHVGKGFVRTPSDFGRRSDPPTHPLLLDWLASRLVEDGWSLKALQRRIVLSSSYAQSSVVDAGRKKADPENRLLWRANPRRVEFEVLRDTLLHASGRLDTRIGGKAVPIFGNSDSRRRTIYGFIDRQNLPPTLRTFDFASPDASTPKRHQTTVPQQALWLMNGVFAREQATQLAARDEIREAKDARERIIRIYRWLFARMPDADEIAAGEAFVAASPTDKTWTSYVHTLFFANELAFVD
jgi:hypothetical protein